MSNINEQNEQQRSGGGAYSDEIIEGHTYDGIQEYDNPMPLWWKAVFALTVIWSPIYIYMMEDGIIDTYSQSLRAEDDYWANRLAKMREKEPPLTPERIKKEFDNPSRAPAGQKIFTTTCAPCHGDKAQGSIGPNLTDKFWLHGGDEQSIFNTITKGVLDKGMPPWGNVLSQDDILNVGSFIHSIKNTNVPGKAPQGDPYVEDGAEGSDGAAAAEGAEGAEPKEGEAAAAEAGEKDGDAEKAAPAEKNEGGDEKAAENEEKKEAK